MRDEERVASTGSDVRQRRVGDGHAVIRAVCQHKLVEADAPRIPGTSTESAHQR